jgi:hypothetical protein
LFSDVSKINKSLVAAGAPLKLFDGLGRVHFHLHQLHAALTLASREQGEAG